MVSSSHWEEGNGAEMVTGAAVDAGRTESLSHGSFLSLEGRELCIHRWEMQRSHPA